MPEQVCFRLDFPRWRGAYSDRDQRIIDDMMIGEHTAALADKYGMTASRVSQKRREYHNKWQRFTDEAQ